MRHIRGVLKGLDGEQGKAERGSAEQQEEMKADGGRGLWRHQVYGLFFCLLPFKVTELHSFCPSTAL